MAFFISTKKQITSKDTIDSVVFKTINFNNRKIPTDKKRIVLICCFSEFGCETIGSLYCIPRVLKAFPGRYFIVAGWYGRDYLYKHLVDCFWEIDEKYMYLRQHCKAFHHTSYDLSKIEMHLKSKAGLCIDSCLLGNYVVANICYTCGASWSKKDTVCPVCKSTYIQKSIFNNIEESKNKVVPIPKPSQEKLDWAKNFIKPNTIGVIARNRSTYGRNLDINFYLKLISLLKNKGYNIVWLGEKETTHACPDNSIVDFSRMEGSRDLEKTFAIICNVKLTIQLWTASSRLSGIMGVPYLIVESPDQIFDLHEGYRLELSTFGDRKILLSDFLAFKNNEDVGLNYIGRCIDEMEQGNFNTVTGLIDGQ